jgi:hypothetical protein
MRFKNPGGQLTWLTPLLAIGGLYLSYTFWKEGAPEVAAICAAFGLCSMLVWFDQKWVAIPLISFYLISFVLGIILLYWKGFTVRYGVRLCMIAYVIYGFWEWYNRPDDEERPELTDVTRGDPPY